MNGNDFDCRIYQKLPQIVLGFHGCDRSVVDRVISSPLEHLRPSANEYDWLGNGIYFWLNDPQRAYEWAVDYARRRPDRVKEPAVVGAIIDLGACLNLCERESILMLQKSYEALESSIIDLGMSVEDVFQNKHPDEGGFSIIRYLDCAVIENLHQELQQESGFSYDTVYGYFQEGADAFPGSGIKEKSHIQICVRNTACIKGYFLPRCN